MKNRNLFFLCLLIYIFSPAISRSQTGQGNSQQIRHVEIVTFQPGTSDSSKHLVDKAYRQAADAFPMVKAFEWGWDDNDKTQTKHVYVTTFNSKGDLTTYNASPQHQAATKKKSIKQVTTIDYYPK